jgi:Arc/MetJ-type ribon-helix-helix transcriptional regulator
MTLTLDAATEQRIQQKIELGQFREPAEVIARALDLLDAEESWSDEEKADLNQKLAESMAQVQRGELYTGEEARQILAERRAQYQR